MRRFIHYLLIILVLITGFRIGNQYLHSGDGQSYLYVIEQLIQGGRDRKQDAGEDRTEKQVTEATDKSESTDKSRGTAESQSTEVEQSTEQPLGEKYQAPDTDIEEAARELRSQMKLHASSASVDFRTDSPDAKELMRQIFTAAIEHTGDPAEGDYLKWQFKGYQAKSSGIQIGDTYRYTFTYNIKYFTTEEEEKELTEKLKQVMEDLHLEGKSDYRKILIIHDYITRHVSYDKSGQNGDLKYTAYSALMKGKAVCQGYATLFYRMSLMAGVDCRIISGKGDPGDGSRQAHAWNIVKIGRWFYNVDSTWDSALGTDKYFLKSDAFFQKDHFREDPFGTEEFQDKFPVASESYSG